VPTRRKINKKITKSICLSERYWEIIKFIGESNQMSNGDVVRDCVIAMQFINEYLGRGTNFTIDYGDFIDHFWDFFQKSRQIDEQVIFERPKDFSDKYVRATTLFKGSFPPKPTPRKEDEE